jgi:hypothetical protein
MNFFGVMLAGFALSGGLLKAEGVLQGTDLAATKGQVISSVDIRPSFTSKTGEFHTENSMELGFRTAWKTELALQHNFASNIFDPSPDERGGLDLEAQDLFLRAGFSPFLKSGPLSLSYAARAYLPLTQSMRDSGMVTILRNYLKLKAEISPSLSITAVELPIVHLHTRAGSVNEQGKASANPILENRVYLITDLQLTEKLSFSFPVMFHAKQHRRFLPDAQNDGAISLFLWTYPEFTLSLRDNLSVGLAYYSDNLIGTGLTAETIRAGLEKGVVQISLAASI